MEFNFRFMLYAVALLMLTFGIGFICGRRSVRTCGKEVSINEGTEETRDMSNGVVSEPDTETLWLTDEENERQCRVMMMRVDEMRTVLRRLRKPVSGLKAELASRLVDLAASGTWIMTGEDKRKQILQVVNINSIKAIPLFALACDNAADSWLKDNPLSSASNH
jgi:hypothetical protein